MGDVPGAGRFRIFAGFCAFILICARIAAGVCGISNIADLRNLWIARVRIQEYSGAKLCEFGRIGRRRANSKGKVNRAMK